MEITFISEHKHFCDCGSDEKMIEYIETIPNGEKWLKRRCDSCNRNYKVARW